MTYEIAGWQFDPTEPVLRGVDGERRLEDRAARVLALLCRRRGEVVSKAELIEDVWNGRIVSANSVSIVMGGLRRALDDDPANPAIIVTVARRGYRLIDDDQLAGDPMPSLATRSERPTAPTVRWLVGALVAIAAVAAFLAIRPAAAITILVTPPRNATGQRSLDRLAVSLAPVVVDGVGHLAGTRLLDGEGGGAARIVVGSKLILWNGAPELALSATDTRAHTVIWSGFAAGPPALLARHAEARIATLAARLPR